MWPAPFKLHDSSSFERALAVAQQRQEETVSELHRLREELRARDDVVKRLRTNLDVGFDAELECRLLKDQLIKLQEGMQKAVGEDERRHREDKAPLKVEAMSGESHASTAAFQASTKKGANNLMKLPLEHLANILSFLDRFSLDSIEFACPKLRAAVATLNGQNFRDLISLEVVGPACDEKGRRVCFTGGGRGGLGSNGPGAAEQCHQIALNTITTVVECSSDPTMLKNGASSATGKLTWQFDEAQKATSFFAGLLRNASVRQLSLSSSMSHYFVQALSAADVDVVVGCLTVKRFMPEAANLATGREALTSFDRLEKLTIDDAPLGLLSDDLLLAATQKRVMSLTLKSPHFRVGSRTLDAAAGPGSGYPELSDGLCAFLFRNDLQESAKVELRFAAARVPQGFCQTLVESALSSGTCYSIDASFVTVNDVTEELIGFEECRLPDDTHGDSVTYRVPDPNATDTIVELKVATMVGKNWGGPVTEWKLVEFRRYRKDDEMRSLND
ncbi:hypothetical protein AAVH_28390 [Aphelenchoides avenae]|nr:hypothetical protein AAVH_28390 [Aphelenchus avenae]